MPVKKAQGQLTTWDNLVLSGTQILLGGGEKERGHRNGNRTEREKIFLSPLR